MTTKTVTLVYNGLTLNFPVKTIAADVTSSPCIVAVVKPSTTVQEPLVPLIEVGKTAPAYRTNSFIVAKTVTLASKSLAINSHNKLLSANVISPGAILLNKDNKLVASTSNKSLSIPLKESAFKVIVEELSKVNASSEQSSILIAATGYGYGDAYDGTRHPFGISYEDTALLADSVMYLFNTTFADISAFIDGQSVSTTKILADTTLATEIIIFALAKAVSDSLATTDMAMTTTGKSVVDTMTSVDSNSYATGKVLADTSTMIDATAVGVLTIATDVLSTSEICQTTTFFRPTFNDSTSLIDSITTITLLRQLVDTSNTSEVQLLNTVKSNIDTLTSVESSSFRIGKIFADSVVTQEINFLLFVKGVTDTIQTSSTGFINVQDYFSSDYIDNSGATPYNSRLFNTL